MLRFTKTCVTLAMLASTHCFAFSPLHGHFLLEGGVYQSTQGQSQHVAITGLIGDQFNVTNRHDTNTIFGVGYVANVWQNNRAGIDLGLNAFYLAKTKVSGTITQEDLFTNLAYKYYVSHLPVYLLAKGYFNTNCKMAVTADLGIGPNFMNTNLYQDSSLDGITVPDNAYTGNFSTTTLSGMAGIGLRWPVHQATVEVGYRYFYLGEGYLNPRTSQIRTQLKTGNNSAQAIIVTLSA